MTVSEEQVRTVPYAVTEPHFVPAERYCDRGFFELEKEKLWRHAWQMACRLEELPEAGDFVEYEVCGLSVLVVRQADGSLKAFENACRHRATQLGAGNGRFGGGQIVCPFHGWRWNLDGTNSFVFHPEQFAPECLHRDDLRLRECLVDTWGGCAWINMDRKARPLREALAPGAQMLERLGVANMRVRYWKEVVVNANWKIAQEAFFEGYHVPQTHPQLARIGGEVATMPGIYEAFANGHGRFAASPESAEMKADAFIELQRAIWEGQDAMTLEREVRLFEGLRRRVPSNESFPEAAVKAFYEYADGAGIPVPEELSSGEVFLFPNFLMLPSWANALSYRSRPYNDDPEWCRFEIWSLETYPVGDEPAARPSVSRYDKEDSEHWGLIPRQDFSNIERQQRGVRTPGFTASRLATSWEVMIANMHQELDRYLSC